MHIKICSFFDIMFYSFNLLCFVSPLRFATLLHQCLNSIKKGSAKEVALASHAIGFTLNFPILHLAFLCLARIRVNLIILHSYRTFSPDRGSWGEGSRDLGRITHTYIGRSKNAARDN